jgi:hypothetical protein
MALKEKIKQILPGDRKENKTIPVSHSKDHPDVQKIADKKLDKMRKKMFGGVGIAGDSLKKNRKMQAKAEKEAKQFMDTLQTMKSKDMTEREGSFAKGGRAGYKDGSKGCGKAKAGRGRAYGKNS